MTFFDVEWYWSELDRQEDRRALYLERLNLVGRATDAATRGALSSITLHDPIVEEIATDFAAFGCSIRVVGGDLQVGHFAASIRLGDVSNLRECARFFRRMLGERIEILYEEFDLSADARYVLRLWFVNGGYLDILAGTLAIEGLLGIDERPKAAPTRIAETGTRVDD